MKQQPAKQEAVLELLEALECSLDFIDSLKSCVPDWRERMKIQEEGFTAKARVAISKATGDA